MTWSQEGAAVGPVDASGSEEAEEAAVGPGSGSEDVVEVEEAGASEETIYKDNLVSSSDLQRQSKSLSVGNSPKKKS